MENKKNKGYYTIAEVITGLRKHYLNNQELLDKMHGMIAISSNYQYSSDLRLSLKEIDGLPIVSLSVINDKKSHNRDVAVYSLVEKNNQYFFRNNNKKSYNGVDPLVIVPSSNQEEFGAYYQELQNTKLYNLPSLFIRINPYQDLYVWGDGIYLNNHDESGRGLDISYDPIEDDISIDSTVRYSTGFANDLLNTKIPKYEFPREYISLLDEEEKMRDSYISDVIGKRREKLDLDEKEKTMYLKRK